MKNLEEWQQIHGLLQELVGYQHQTMVQCAQRILPHVTPEDLLQPNDFPELEENPHFRYEEGMLAGIQTVQMALWSLNKQ